ncbi:3'-5' exonuclease [Mitsuokella sp.]|uniref:3'-5' exonuclease n=1 Tax=Mitsuokella sp. TaxID=2049034 RepID=UPI003D7D3BD2
MEFEELNPAQREAVQDLQNNILLLAPAGTGKTNTLACRIANILEQKRAEPEEILCLTFTNKACREMKERIVMRAGEAGRRVIVKTFHGFCYDVIKTEAKRHSDLFADFTIFDETDCLGIVRELLEEKWPERSVQSLIAGLKSARTAYHLESGDDEADYQEALRRLMQEHPEAVRKLSTDEHYQFYRQLFEGWQVWGPHVTALYDARLHDIHGLDFTDLIVQADALFRQDEIATKWARRFLYINIDEVQDTSELEYRIMARIFGCSHLLLCGDYFQTIYEWRGSHPETVLRAYQRDWQPCRLVLTENYRSTQVLLSASFACLQQLFPERVSALYPEGLHAVSPEYGPPIVLKGAVSFQEEAQWIYYTIQQLGVKDYSSVCVLTRSNRYNKDLSSYFRGFGCHLPDKERLPFMLIDEVKFYRRQEVKDVLAFLKLILNPHDTASFVRILNRFGKGIGPGTIRRISQESYRRAGIRITDYLDDDARRTGDPFAVLLKALDEDNVVVFDVEATGVDPTRDEIIQIAGIRLSRDGSVKAEFKRLLKAARSVGDSVRVHHIEDDMLQQEGQEPAQVLRDFCEFAKDAVIVGHNVTYDLSILGSELTRLGLPQLKYRRYYDTLDIFRRFYPNLPNHKLEYLGEFCKVSHRSTHDAMDDICATSEILLFAVEHNIKPYAEERRAFMEKWQALFTDMAEKISSFRRDAEVMRPWQLIGQIVVKTQMDDYYRRRNEETRIENLRDLFRQARDMDEKEVRPLDALLRFLNYTVLSNTNLDALTKRQQIPIITVHQAKGSEFDYVFVAGLQEGNFPGLQAEKNDTMAEEARLFYVAITRPKKQLFLSWCQSQRGHYTHMSRFLRTLPRRYVQNV